MHIKTSMSWTQTCRTQWHALKYECFVQRVRRSNTAHKTVHVQAFSQTPSWIPSVAIDTANGQWATHLGIANGCWVIGPNTDGVADLVYISWQWSGAGRHNLANHCNRMTVTPHYVHPATTTTHVAILGQLIQLAHISQVYQWRIGSTIWLPTDSNGNRCAQINVRSWTRHYSRSSWTVHAS